MKTLQQRVVERFAALGLLAKSKDSTGRERELITLPTALTKDDVGVGLAGVAPRGVLCPEVLAHEDEAEVCLECSKGHGSRLEELRHLARGAGIPSADADDFEARLLTFTASDETRDRYGDKILVDGSFMGKKYGRGWQTKEFRKNPVFCSQHQHREVPLGVSLDTWTDVVGKAGHERKRLRMTVLTDDGEANPAAPRVLKAFQSRLLRMCSVGFLPEWSKVFEPKDADERSLWGLGSQGYLFAEQELLENSAVTIPANPNAGLEGFTGAEAVRYLRFVDEIRDVDPAFGYALRDQLLSGAGLVDLGASRANVADLPAMPARVREDPSPLTPEAERGDDASVTAEAVADLARAVTALSDKIEANTAELGRVVARVAEGAHGKGASGTGVDDAPVPDDSDPYEKLLRGFTKLGEVARAQ